MRIDDMENGMSGRVSSETAVTICLNSETQIQSGNSAYSEGVNGLCILGIIIIIISHNNLQAATDVLIHSLHLEIDSFGRVEIKWSGKWGFCGRKD